MHDTTDMTTGQLRTLARKEAQAMHWSDAADLLRLAIDRYPPHHPDSAMALADKTKMQERADEWRHMGETRTLLIYTYGPSVTRGEPKLGVVHTCVPMSLTDEEIIERYRIPKHWRAEIEGPDGLRILQEAVF